MPVLSVPGNCGTGADDASFRCFRREAPIPRFTKTQYSRILSVCVSFKPDQSEIIHFFALERDLGPRWNMEKSGRNLSRRGFRQSPSPSHPTPTNEEEALEDHSPLESNLKALRRSHPELASRIEAAPELPPGLLFTTPSGRANLRFPLEDGRFFRPVCRYGPRFRIKRSDGNRGTRRRHGHVAAGVRTGLLGLVLC
jgi:hypothetical protein